jgi:hypothetical protein
MIGADLADRLDAVQPGMMMSVTASTFAQRK